MQVTVHIPQSQGLVSACSFLGPTFPDFLRTEGKLILPHVKFNILKKVFYMQTLKHLLGTQ